MNVRRWLLFVVVSLLSTSSAWAAIPEAEKHPEANQPGRRGVRSYSVAPAASAPATRSYRYYVPRRSTNTLFRTDHKIPGLYLH